MNKVRRKQLAEVSSILETAKGMLEEIRDDEQDYFDNMPENLQGSERGEASEEAIDAMDEAIESLESAIESVSDASSV